MKKEINNNEEINPSEITRKQAIKKMGKYGALISLGTFMILNPKQAQAMSAAVVVVIVIAMIRVMILLRLHLVLAIS